MNAGELLDIIDELRKNSMGDVKSISSKAGIDRSYLSKLINGDPNKEVTERLLRKLDKAYKGYFIKNTTQDHTKGHPEAGKVVAIDFQAKYVEAVERESARLFELAKTNLNEILVLSRSLKYEVSSARVVSLQSLSRLEGQNENFLLEEANKLMIARGLAGQEQGKKV